MLLRYHAHADRLNLARPDAADDIDSGLSGRALMVIIFSISGAAGASGESGRG